MGKTRIKIERKKIDEAEQTRLLEKLSSDHGDEEGE